MRIESIIEDLEAQGFFANQLSSQKSDKKFVTTMKLVFIESNISELLLHSPIRGKDFVAGFALKADKAIWYLIPESTGVMLETRFTENSFLTTKLNLKKILENHVLRHELVVVLSNNAGQLRGKLTRVSGKELVIADGSKLTWVSIAAIQSVIVENFNRFI